MVPLIQREIIDNRKWISADEFLDLLALAQSSPGPIAINTSVFVGYKMRGILGSIVCIVGTILASFVIILLIAMFFSDFTKYPLVESAFKGMRPVVVALIAAPVYGMAKGMGWIKITLAAAVAVIVGFLGVSPVYFLIAGVVGGIIWGLSNKGRVKE